MLGINEDISWDKIRKINIDWWNRVGKNDIKEKPATKKTCYDVFLAHFNIDTNSFSDKVVGEVCPGPYGGIIQCYNIQCEQKYFIDIFMDDFKEMNLSDWGSNSVFINAPCEHVHIEDNKIDFLFGYNSIDHGWDWKKSIDECLRVSKSMYLMFDTKGFVDGDFHPQSISHQDVLDYVEQQGWRSKFKKVIIEKRYKDYGYYETKFDWPETWVYVEK